MRKKKIGEKKAKVKCAICGQEKKCVKNAADGILERSSENTCDWLMDALVKVKADADPEEIKALTYRIEDENSSPDEILDLDICEDCMVTEQCRYIVEILQMELIHEWMKRNKGKVKHLDDIVIDEFRMMVDNDYDATRVSREKVRMLLKVMGQKN